MLKRAFLSILLILLALVATAFCQNGMRVMPTEELSQRADAIVRGHVKKVEKAAYLGTYTQVATLTVTDIIKGDSRLKEIRVWAGSMIFNANDFYTKDLEVLVFIVKEQTFYRTLNYQYGQFLIEGETVKGWRAPAGGPPSAPPEGGVEPPPPPMQGIVDYVLVDKNYGEVRKEIETAIRNRPTENPKK